MCQIALSVKEAAQMQKKRISVSQKRQITIPIEFFNRVGIENEVECHVQSGSIIIRPIKESGGEFAEEILADLIAQGFSGAELLQKFKETNRQIRPAVEAMLAEANLVAEGKAPYYTMEEIFDEEEN